MAAMAGIFAQLERRLIGQRTKEALAIAKARGVHCGRRSELAPSTRERIVEAIDSGEGWSALAKRFNAEGVPTGQGGQRWYPATVRSAYLAAKRNQTPDVMGAA
jgi:DNA invertase Pin-like site-specific DNA recombinase